jgi:hypothetical protein
MIPAPERGAERLTKSRNARNAEKRLFGAWEQAEPLEWGAICPEQHFQQRRGEFRIGRNCLALLAENQKLTPGPGEGSMKTEAA